MNDEADSQANDPSQVTASSQPASSQPVSASTASRRFCVQCLAMCALGFAAIATLNFVVNPYAQYPTRLFRPLVQTSRSQKVEILKRLSPPPEGLVLGSSRVLKLEPDYLESKTGIRFCNVGVNYGKVEDYLAMLRLYEETYGRSPRMVVIGLDIHGFSDSIPTDARLLSNPLLSAQVPDVIPFADRFHRWEELLSWQQTKMSLKSLRSRGADDAAPIKSFRDDGLIVYHQREQQIAEGDYDFEGALDYNRNEYKHLFLGYDQLSLKRAETFFKIADYCRRNRSQLAVFLTPLHPRLQQHLVESTSFSSRKKQVTEFVRSQAMHHGFAFVDLSTVSAFDGDEQAFVDGIHPLEPNTRLMIDRIVQQVNAGSENTYAVQ